MDGSGSSVASGSADPSTLSVILVQFSRVGGMNTWRNTVTKLCMHAFCLCHSSTHRRQGRVIFTVLSLSLATLIYDPFETYIIHRVCCSAIERLARKRSLLPRIARWANLASSYQRANYLWPYSYLYRSSKHTFSSRIKVSS